MKEKPTNDDILAGELFGVARPVKTAREIATLPNPLELWRSVTQGDAMSVSRYYCSNCGHVIRITEKAVSDISKLIGTPEPSPADLDRTYYLVRACLLCSDHYEAPKLLAIPDK